MEIKINVSYLTHFLFFGSFSYSPGFSGAADCEQHVKDCLQQLVNKSMLDFNIQVFAEKK